MQYLKCGRQSLWCQVILVATMASFASVEGNYGVIYAEDDVSGNHGSYCMMYNPDFNQIETEKDSAKKENMVNLTSSEFCSQPTNLPVLSNSIAFVARGSCNFSDKAGLVQKNGGDGAVIVSSRGLVEPAAVSLSDYNEINITVAVMSQDDFSHLLKLGPNIKVQLYSPAEGSRMDFNLIVIWLLAVGTLTAGAFWSGVVKHSQYLKQQQRRRDRLRGGADAAEPDDEEDQDSFEMSPMAIVIFVVLMCGMLLTLYFFYDYLVYVVIAMFTLASSTALYGCIKPLLLKIKCIGACQIPDNRIPLLKRRPEIRLIMLALCCIGFAVWWAVVRNESYAWILQDILGVSFCIHMMKTIRLPHLKACTILLVLLFFYDIFFVFITPYFTKSGQSVMVDVATGGGSSTGETLPMVLKVPRFGSSMASLCSSPYSLLGFGDILVPGLLVSFCHGFDMRVGSRRVYFISTVIAYGVGLIVTFVALALMQQGQPALLYLVPCTMLTTLAVGLKRREVKLLWRGKVDSKKNRSGSRSQGDAGAEDHGTGADGAEAESGEPEAEGQSSDSEQPLLVNK